MTRYIDFDAARAERQHEPVVVRAFGRDWELPPELPAAAMLDIVRLYRKGADADVSEFEMLAILEGIVPRETLDGWLDAGVSFTDLVDLLRTVVQTYLTAVSPTEEATPGEAPPPSVTSASSSVNAGG